jgi:hypothetical protein
MRIITLTAIPPRFPYLEPTLTNLVNQNSVDEVRLYIPKVYKRFPEYKGKLPKVPKGVKVCIVDEDFGPATKILPAAKEFRDKQDVQLLFCDDDIMYPKDWAKKLFDIQEKRENEAVAVYGRRATKERCFAKKPHAKEILPKYDISYRFARLLSKIFKLPNPHRKPIIKAGYTDILFGVGGVVVRGHFFDDEAFDIPDVAWLVDDIWLSGQLAKNNIPLYCPRRLPFGEGEKQAEIDSLLYTDFMGHERHRNNKLAIKYCQEKYGIWK